jgi:CBS domain-containing protein
MLLWKDGMGTSVRAMDVMATAVVTVSPDLSLGALEDLLLSHRISGVPVVEKGTLLGVVSRSDVVRMLSIERSLSGIIRDGFRGSAFAPGEEGTILPLPQALAEQLQAHTVRDAMVTDPITVSPDTPIGEVAKTLVDRHVHRVLVTENRELRGVISSLDVVCLVADGRLS